MYTLTRLTVDPDLKLVAAPNDRAANCWWGTVIGAGQGDLYTIQDEHGQAHEGIRRQFLRRREELRAMPDLDSDEEEEMSMSDLRHRNIHFELSEEIERSLNKACW